MTAAGETGLDLERLRRDLAGAADGSRLKPLGLGRVVAGAGALEALADVVAEVRRPGGDVVVLAAATPIRAGGRDLRAVVEEALGARFPVRWAVLRPGGHASTRRSGATSGGTGGATGGTGGATGGASGGSPVEHQTDLVHADEATVAAAAAAAAGAGCVVTVGSGTITDIGKAAAPGAAALVAVQTATSVNGYADPFSVLLRRGVKRTTPSRWPDALVIDPDVLTGAPPALNRAGAGDLMAMFTASADWYLAGAVTGADAGAGDPPYHPAVAGLTLEHGRSLLALMPRLDGGPAAGPAGAPAGPGARHGDGRRPDPASLAGLADLLTRSGIAMGVAGSTAPSSGMEHAVSHLLEMAATATGQRGSLHGEQVGVASVVAARTWEHVLRHVAGGGLDREARLPDPDDVQRRTDRAFAVVDPSGAMAAECFDDYARKLRRLGRPGGPLAALRSSWAAHRAALDGMLADPAVLAGALRSAGLPTRFGDLPEPVDDATARWAVAACPLLRQRFGVADLAMLLGVWGDDDVDEVLAGSGAVTGRP